LSPYLAFREGCSRGSALAGMFAGSETFPGHIVHTINLPGMRSDNIWPRLVDYYRKPTSGPLLSGGAANTVCWFGGPGPRLAMFLDDDVGAPPGPQACMWLRSGWYFV
jgi:hypothetical protein